MVIKSFKMASKYRLIYFNVTGIAEPIRYLLAYGRIPFEDVRLEYDEWLKYKNRTPFGLIPVLEIEGKTYHQSSAICRHLAKKLNLTGKNDEDAFQADIIVDSITDFRLNYAAYFRLETDFAKEQKLTEIKQIHNPYYLGKFEQIVKENGGNFIKNQLSWADFFFAGLSDLWIKVIGEPILDNYPNLKTLKEKIENEPNVKTYRKTRPKTIY